MRSPRSSRIGTLRSDGPAPSCDRGTQLSCAHCGHDCFIQPATLMASRPYRPPCDVSLARRDRNPRVIV